MASSKARESTSSIQKQRFQICIIDDVLKQNEPLMEAIEHFQLPVVHYSQELESSHEERDFTCIYINEEFGGEIFTHLQDAGHNILGPPVVIWCAKFHKDFLTMYSSIRRPLYTFSMRNIVICFSGFRSKQEMTDLVQLIHYMGGSIRREFSISKTTHLVAASPATLFGEKYKYAASLGIPVMKTEWIYKTWNKRHDINYNALSQELMQYRFLPLAHCKLAFLGYQSEDRKHMTEICIKNGGGVVDPRDRACTHIVVEDGFSITRCLYSKRIHVLKNEWFWACIQMEARADEKLYHYEDGSWKQMSMSLKQGEVEDAMYTFDEKLNMGFFRSSVRIPTDGNKHEILESIAHQLARGIEDLQPTDSTDGGYELIWSRPLDVYSLSPRQQVCTELYQTESNYVNILQTMITLFKNQLEEPTYIGRPLLAPAEVKIIFGNLPPIYDVHIKILSKLSDAINNRKDHSIGNIILSHVDELMKSYPPYVNFLEKSKDMLQFCDATKPRFHAFLKRCQSKPECGRQALSELLIRPVQRLPSVILLLNEILKHTPEDNWDHAALEKAIYALKGVLLHINEDKRKTDGQMTMFDTVNDIENCPPNLLSAHRTLISKTDVQEITDLLTKRGTPITMLLFTDVLEISKKRNKEMRNEMNEYYSARSEIAIVSTKSHSKTYKHLELIPLSHIKRVVSITETEDCPNAFAIVFWSSKESKELLYAFCLGDTCKSTFLRSLCHQIAHSLCKADAEYLLTCLDSKQLNLNTSEMKGNTIKKTLNKTLSKFGSTSSLRSNTLKLSLSRGIASFFDSIRNFKTPSNSLSILQVSSFTDLTVIEPPLPTPVVQKRKSGSFGGFPVINV